MNKLEVLLSSVDTHTVLSRLLGTELSIVSERYKKFHSRLNKKRFVVSVAGVQGSGKSTMLNALTFDDSVLPIQADETTCVPVEIGYSETSSGKAQVRYTDGTTEQIPANESALAIFVDNKYNPGNSRLVDRVVLQSADKVLEHGLVLVDLPGVGSLTESNVNTTRKYLGESIGVIFVLRTVPPITRSESIFIAQQWVQLPTAWFIQNRWTDETNEEAEAGRLHNLKVLKGIAENNRIRLNGDPVIHLVTAYHALKGRLTGNQEETRRSGILDSAKSLRDHSIHWPQLVRKQIHESVGADLISCTDIVAQRMTDYKKDKSRLKADIEDAERRYAQYMDDTQSKINEATTIVREFIVDQKRSTQRWVADARAQLRNQMRTLVRKGLIDGPRLSTALQEEQGRQGENLSLHIQEQYMAHCDKIRQHIAHMVTWQNGNVSTIGIDTPTRTPYENLAKPILTGLASIGGAWGGLTYGATLGSAGGPIGLIVGGILGALIGGFLGWGTKRVVASHQSSELLPKIFDAIDHFVETSSTDVIGQLEKHEAGVKNELEKWLHSQTKQFQAELDYATKTMHASREEQEAALKGLEADELALKAWLSDLNEESI